MLVVCAGPKAILDVPSTLEYLETRGVPVVALGQAEMPGFFARTSGIPAPVSVADEAALLRSLGPTRAGPRLEPARCVPVPAAAALSLDEARAAVERAIDRGRGGGHRTARP